jgi:hypothetical protein
MNDFGRIALCGMISGYDGEPMALAHPRLILTARLKLQGFIVSEHMNLWPAGAEGAGQRVASGQLKYRETVAQGLAAAPAAFLGLLKGRNFGKQLVKLRLIWHLAALCRARPRRPLRRTGPALPRLRARAGPLPGPRRHGPSGLAPAGP